MKIQSKKIVLIGAGNAATQLGIALKDVGHTIIQVYSPTKKSATTLASLLNTKPVTDQKKINTGADIYIIAIKDDKIREVAKKLKLKNKIVVHTSGSTSLDVLKTVSNNYGVFYPLQTFSKGKKTAFKSVPVCLEASNDFTFKILHYLAKNIGAKAYKINSDQRKAIHVAAVFACNFSNHLYAIADHILSDNKLPFDILKPLIAETAEKIKNNSPVKMQTGPAVRGDKKIMDTHLKMLSGNKKYRQLYKLLSQSIIASDKNK